MGRIAEALKRAQQERERRATADPSAAAGGVAVADAAEQNASAAAYPDGDEVARAGSSVVAAPPSPQPFSVTTLPVAAEQVDRRVVAFHAPTSPLAEKYRSARTRLMTANPEGGARTFAVTSSLPREGKTITTANLGFSLAELRHLRVAIIDGDFRQAGLSRLFSASHKPGLAEVIRGEHSLSEVALPVVRNNLYLIPAGDSQGACPSELLGTTSVMNLFREINGRFHYALIDAPPMHTVADIGLIGPLCHSVVIVIRLARTPEQLLQRCVGMLQANHVNIAGSILTGYCEKSMGYTDNQNDYYENVI